MVPPSARGWQVKPLIALALTSGCIPLSSLPQQPRTAQSAQSATVRIESDCPDWSTKYGSGVALDSYRVLTAAHVVSCPGFPVVHVIKADGTRLIARVDIDDAAYGAGRDLARVYTFESLGPINPPALGRWYHGDIATAHLPSGVVTGSFTSGAIIDDMVTHAGDSGSGVYSEGGELVGIVVASGESHTRYTAVDAALLIGVTP